RHEAARLRIRVKSAHIIYHSHAYELFRNGALDARDFFAPASEPAPKYLRNQFGGSVGGPLVKDRLFFFGDYEGTRIRQGITRITKVPTEAERAADFSESLVARPINPLTQRPFPDK